MRVTSPPRRFVAISLIESAAYVLVPTRWIHATVLPLPNFPAKHTIAMVRGLQHRQLSFQHQICAWLAFHSSQLIGYPRE